MHLISCGATSYTKEKFLKKSKRLFLSAELVIGSTDGITGCLAPDQRDCKEQAGSTRKGK